MKIFLFGYGQMGKEIEKLAIGKGFTIHAICDPFLNKHFIPDKLVESDVAIDFSLPESTIENMLTCFRHKIPVVVGTTGWYDQLEYVSKECKKQDATLFYASNFSIGVNILFKLNKQLAALTSQFPGYDLEIFESHHTKKKDAPSGTAWSLANDILTESDKYKTFKAFSKEEKPESGQQALPVYYSRENDVIGIHEITCSSEIDQIRIRHEAFNRKGFAAGTLIASEWVLKRKGVYTMKDII